MRVGIVALIQESNTFLAGKTTLAHFERDFLIEGDSIRERLAGTHHEIGGFLEGLSDPDVEIVPIFVARALPYGTIEPDAFDALTRQLLTAVAKAGSLDGLLVAPHGATVAANAPDADGEWLTRLRDQVGSIPIVGTLDLHANLSPRMVDACNALIGYRSNPHLDQRQRGLDAARLLLRTLRKEVTPRMAAAFPPLIANIERQLTAESPCQELYALADQQLSRPGILSNTLLLGFPYADVAEMGSAVIAVADGDADLTTGAAIELASAWWDNRVAFAGQLIDPESAITQALASPGPVCLLDMGDNVGGGSPGDGTILAHALHRRKVARSYVCLADAEAVEQARLAGVGAKLTLSMGGKNDALHGPPLIAEVTVRSLSEGKFTESNPRHGGISSFDQGLSAVVETDTGLTILLTTRRMVPFSINQLVSCGLDPHSFQILVAKGVHAPVAAYAPICPTRIRVNTPGVTTADLSALTFHHRRRPMYPFEPDCSWTPVAHLSRSCR